MEINKVTNIDCIENSFDVVLKFPQIYKVMQYIGIKDKNGVEIYEGDILLHEDTNYGYGGKYDKEHDGYLRTQVPYIETLLDGYFEFEEFHNWQVIGNIYENPEYIPKLR